LVAGPRRARLRMVQAFAARSDLTTISVPSIGHLLSLGCADTCELVVAYCDSISSEDMGVFKQLKRQSPELLIVAVCGVADRRAVRRLIDGGADALVLFDQLETALAPTVAAVFAGQMVVPRDLRASLDKPALSSRERQILGMVVTGLTNHEVSSRMFLAESTVKSHLSSAYNKLGVRSRSEAAALILDGNGSLGTDIVAASPDARLRAV
jgi:DNA-binding NarL/FixJ family response regulator